MEYKHYITVNENGYVTNIKNDKIFTILETDILWKESDIRNEMLNLINFDGTYNYKYSNNEVIACTNEDMETQLLAEKPDLIRLHRKEKFDLYDKYQLILLWGELTEQQKTDYETWREDWLNAPQALTEPIDLEWFV
jgi:hypothetical protein